MQDIRTDLGAEFDVPPFAPEVLDLLFALPPVEVGQPRLQDPHGHRAVLELGAFVLAGGLDAGGQVDDPHGGVGGVHRLTAGPGRTVDIDPEVLRVDLDVLVVLLGQQGDHVERGERGVPSVRLVERAQSHQPVDPALRAEKAVSVRAVEG